MAESVAMGRLARGLSLSRGESYRRHLGYLSLPEGLHSLSSPQGRPLSQSLAPRTPSPRGTEGGSPLQGSGFSSASLLPAASSSSTISNPTPKRTTAAFSLGFSAHSRAPLRSSATGTVVGEDDRTGTAESAPKLSDRSSIGSTGGDLLWRCDSGELSRASSSGRLEDAGGDIDMGGTSSGGQISTVSSQRPSTSGSCCSQSSSLCSDARNGPRPSTSSSSLGEASDGVFREGSVTAGTSGGALLLELMAAEKSRGGLRGALTGGQEAGGASKPQLFLVRPMYPACRPTVAFCQGGPQEAMACGYDPIKQRPAVKFVGVGNNAVKSAFKQAGFRKVSGDKWDALWSGGALKPAEYQELNRYQKVNHFPGTWELGRKDKLYRHIAQARRRHAAEYDFLPRFFLLPEELKEWTADCERFPNECYIVKPRNLSRGRGIKVVRKPADLKKMRECLVQRYVLNPHLINGYKYDLRLYVVVTCWDPLRVYLYKDGLVRFATEKYRTDSAGLKKKYAHITNTSVNSKNKKFAATAAEDEDGAGTKWSLSALQRHYLEQGLPYHYIWAQIKDLVVKTLIAVEPQVNTLCQMNLGTQSNCFELYGFDVLIDSAQRAWLLEVNTGPALQCPTPLDKRVKHSMVTDMLHLVGFVSYDRSELEAEEGEKKAARLLGLDRGRPLEDPFSKRKDIKSLEDVDLSNLTGSNAPTVVQEGENEYARRGGFERVFPTKDSHRYAHLFESQRYFNVLYSKWLQQQHSPPLWNNFSPSAFQKATPSKSPPRASGRLSAPATLWSGYQGGARATGDKKGVVESRASSPVRLLGRTGGVTEKSDVAERRERATFQGGFRHLEEVKQSQDRRRASYQKKTEPRGPSSSSHPSTQNAFFYAMKSPQ